MNEGEKIQTRLKQTSLSNLIPLTCLWWFLDWFTVTTTQSASHQLQEGGLAQIRILISCSMRGVLTKMTEMWTAALSRNLIKCFMSPCYWVYYHCALIQQKTFYWSSLIKLKAKPLTDKNFINCFKNIARKSP